MRTLVRASHFQKAGNSSRVRLLAGVSPRDVSPSCFYHAAVNVFYLLEIHRSPRQAVLYGRTIAFYQVLKTQSDWHCIEFIG